LRFLFVINVALMNGVAAWQEEFEPHIEPVSGEAAAAMASIEAIEGIELELFAAEPLLANPVCLYVDHLGDLFVAESFRCNAGVTDMREHMDWLDEDLANRTVEERLAMMRAHVGEDYDPDYGTAFEQVRLIRDTDGDGKADRDFVFATGFSDHADGIGAGLLSYRGDVFYTCIPHLWRLRDLDGDGRAEKKVALSSGYGVNIALLGHDLHGLRIGPDQRLYFSCGDRGFHVETAQGTIAHPHAGAVLRCNLDGTNLEVWHTGLRNPQELVFDLHGNLFTGDNNSDGGDKARWVNVVEGGESGWRYAYQWITSPVMRGPWNDEKLWHPPHKGQAAYIVPPIANLASGPSGLTYYPGTGLDSSYDRHFFLCDFRGDAKYSGVHVFRTHAQGAFWELGETRRFLWNTLATDIDFGPDGSMYFSDWVHGWTKTGKGRIYRAYHPEGRSSALARETRSILREGTYELSTEKLIRLLEHPDQRVRQEAHFALAEREAVEALTRKARDGGLLARLHALWGLGIAAREDIRALAGAVPLTEDPDPEVRAQAVRVLGDEWYFDGADAIRARISDSEPRVRFFASIAAGRLGIEGAIEPLTRVLIDAGEDDPNLRHAGVMGLLGCADEATLERLSDHESAHVRMGALLVYRRRSDPAIGRFLEDSDPLLVLEAARAIHDRPIEGALENLALHDCRTLPAGREAALVRRVLNANLRGGNARTLADLALRPDLEDAFRVEAIDMLVSWADPSDRDRVNNTWIPLAPRSVDKVRALTLELAQSAVVDGSPALVKAFTRLIAAMEVGELSPALCAWVEDPARHTGVRVAALEAMQALGSRELARAVRASLGDPIGRVRAAALIALEELAPEDALVSLPAILEGGEITERRAAYRILGRMGPGAKKHILAELELLEAGLLPQEFALDLVQAAEMYAQFDPIAADVAARLDVLHLSRRAEPELAFWVDGLFGGDPDRGREVYQRTELSCVRCHETGDDTMRVGPDLRGVSRRLTRLQMLESIVLPNRRTTPGFQGTVFYMLDESVVNGRMLEETADGIRVIDSDGVTTTLDPAEVDERRADLSAMPEDIVKSLDRSEMRDLLAYLGDL